MAIETTIQRLQSPPLQQGNPYFRAYDDGVSSYHHPFGHWALSFQQAQALVRLEGQVPTLTGAQPNLLDWQPPSLDAVRCFLDEFNLGRRLQSQLERCYWWC